MVYIKVLCPDCGSDNVVRYGKNSTNRQRFLCRNDKCSRKTFQLEYKLNACKPGVKQQVVEMVQNGSGTRDTGRVLGISKDTVTAILKKNRKISQAN
jgi:transposase-like protein